MEYKVQSLAKAIKVLECFTVAKPEWGVSEIARFTGFQKSTVHNILTTLQQLGYVEQNPETQRWG